MIILKKIKFKNMFYKKNVLDKISQEIDKIISLNKILKFFMKNKIQIIAEIGVNHNGSFSNIKNL